MVDNEKTPMAVNMAMKLAPTLIKALGIEPDALLQNLYAFQNGVAGKLGEFDARLRQLEENQRIALSKLDTLITLLSGEENGRAESTNGFDIQHGQRDGTNG